MNCGREFECYDKVKNRNGVRHKIKRPVHCITCSMKCSKENILKRRKEYMKEYSKRPEVIARHKEYYRKLSGKRLFLKYETIK